MNFHYFRGPSQDMDHYEPDEGLCAFCGALGPGFRLDGAICKDLPEEEQVEAIGCPSCLRSGRFGFWHETEVGSLDETGLIARGPHHPPPSGSFPISALAELRRTPPIACHRQELWLVHCYDFMAYLGTWRPEEFAAHDPDRDGGRLFREMTEPAKQHLWNEQRPPSDSAPGSWDATYYAFRCLHCGKLRGYWDRA